MTLSHALDGERWYEFEQHELLVRPFWVRASSLQEARQKVRDRKSGSGIGVPDEAPNGPDYIKIMGRGRLADADGQAIADERFAELGGMV